MMFSIVNNQNDDVYVKYTINKFNKANDWGFKQLIHKNAILHQQDKFLRTGSLYVRVKMRLDEHKNEFVKKLNDNLHYCKILSENFSQYYYNTDEDENADNTSACAATWQSQALYYDIVLIVKNPDANAVEEASGTSCVASKRRKSNDTQILPASKRQNTASTNTSTSVCTTSSYTSDIHDPSHYPSPTEPNKSATSSGQPLPIPILANKLFNSIVMSSQQAPTSTALTQLSSSTTPSSCCSSSIGSSIQSVQDNLTVMNSMMSSTVTSTSSVLTTTSTHPSSISNSESGASVNSNCSESNCADIDQAKTSDTSTCNNSTSNSGWFLISSYPSKGIKILNSWFSPFKVNKNPSASNSQASMKTQEIHEFKAHKCILAARSPVFKAMFNYKLKENLTNKVVIEDCKPEVVKAMLKYIYTAYLPDDIEHIAIDLFIAAEKYYIDSLKVKVREHLVENLCADNALQIYVLSEIYNDSMLRKQSLKYIRDNIDKITQNSDWDLYLVMYPQYFTNAFIHLCKKDF
jgi:hypothetical protein